MDEDYLNYRASGFVDIGSGDVLWHCKHSLHKTIKFSTSHTAVYFLTRPYKVITVRKPTRKRKSVRHHYCQCRGDQLTPHSLSTWNKVVLRAMLLFLPCLTTSQCVIGVIVQNSILLQPEKPPIEKIDSQESQLSGRMVWRRTYGHRVMI